LHPTLRKIGHFRDVLPSQSLGTVLKKLDYHTKASITHEHYVVISRDGRKLVTRVRVMLP